MPPPDEEDFGRGDLKWMPPSEREDFGLMPPSEREDFGLMPPSEREVRLVALSGLGCFASAVGERLGVGRVALPNDPGGVPGHLIASLPPLPVIVANMFPGRPSP